MVWTSTLHAQNVDRTSSSTKRVLVWLLSVPRVLCHSKFLCVVKALHRVYHHKYAPMILKHVHAVLKTLKKPQKYVAFADMIFKQNNRIRNQRHNNPSLLKALMIELQINWRQLEKRNLYTVVVALWMVSDLVLECL